MDKSNCKVCVTGGAGYIGSWLLKKLIEKGYTVHATLRNLDDRSKVDFLKSFNGAESRLVLFEADLYDPVKFDPAIQGCDFVFHVATPLLHTEGYQFKNASEAAVAAAKSIATSCVQSGTVRRLMYTASMGCASPLKEDGSGFKDFIDETCWTPPNLSFAHSTAFLLNYIDSKMRTEKEILSFGTNAENGGLEVVSLAIGLVGGDTLLSYTPASLAACVSQLSNDENMYQTLRYTEESLGKVPIVHIDDVCEAQVFCMEQPSMNGRFFCASSYVSRAEMANYYRQNYPEFHVKQEDLVGPKREIKWAAKKLIDKGFEYKCDTKMILDDSLECARRNGDLKQ